VTWLWVCIGAAVGAPARYLVDRAVQARHGSAFPAGTLSVNLAGSLLLGAIVGAAGSLEVPPWVGAGLGTGFCGALTTYSTFGSETVRLAEGGATVRAAVYVALSVLGCIGAATLGYLAGTSL
jgi:CrcB protein